MRTALALLLALSLPSLVRAQGIVVPSAVGTSGVSKKRITAPEFVGPVVGIFGAPVIPNDHAGLQSHLTWDGAALVESVTGSGVTWTHNGTVPQVQRSWLTNARFQPSGSGPYSTANYYDAGTSALNFTSLSVCGLVTTASIATEQHLVSKDGESANQRAFDLEVISSTFKITIFNAAAAAFSVSSATTTVAVHFVCMSYQTGSTGTAVIRLQVDGVDSSPNTTADPMQPSSTAKFDVGRRAFAGAEQPWLGYIHEVGVWNRALSAAEMSALYARAKVLAIF